MLWSNERTPASLSELMLFCKLTGLWTTRTGCCTLWARARAKDSIEFYGEVRSQGDTPRGRRRKDREWTPRSNHSDWVTSQEEGIALLEFPFTCDIYTETHGQRLPRLRTNRFLTAYIMLLYFYPNRRLCSQIILRGDVSYCGWNAFGMRIISSQTRSSGRVTCELLAETSRPLLTRRYMELVFLLI